MTTYESVFIIKPTLSDTEVADLLDKTKKIIAQEGGEVVGEDKWGRRRLAAPILKNREGNYIQLKFNGNPAVLSKLDHHCRVTDAVMRNFTIKVRPVKERRKKAKAK